MAGRTGRRVSSDEPIPMPDVIEHEDVIAAEAPPPAKTTNEQPAVVAVPEHSHPGESASNGLSERSVQTFEDQFRTFKIALEANLGHHLPNDHPVLPWLVEHTSYILNKYMLGTDGFTSMGRLHGKEIRERICEFGEVVLWYIPIRLRGKLDVRWRYGFFWAVY